MAACLSWDSENNPDLRGAVADVFANTINKVIDHEPIGQTYKAFDAIQALRYSVRHKFSGIQKEGLRGYSVIQADNGDTPGVARPHMSFVTSLGNTGILLPTLVGYEELPGQDNAYYPVDADGLYAIDAASNNRDPIDGLTIGFRQRIIGLATAHIGLGQSIKPLSRTIGEPLAAPTYGSITLDLTAREHHY